MYTKLPFSRDIKTVIRNIFAKPTRVADRGLDKLPLILHVDLKCCHCVFKFDSISKRSIHYQYYYNHEVVAFCHRSNTCK